MKQDVKLSTSILITTVKNKCVNSNLLVRLQTNEQKAEFRMHACTGSGAAESEQFYFIQGKKACFNFIASVQ